MGNSKRSSLAAWLSDHGTRLGLATMAGGVVLVVLASTALVGWRIFKIPTGPIVAELGGACLIAGVLSLTLERVLVSRLTEEVRAGVEAYYLTYGLPKEFGDEVLYVRDVRLARKDYHVRIRIWDHEANADKVHVEFDVSYAVINFSDQHTDYHQKMVIEETGEDSARIVRITRTGADLSNECVTEVRGSMFDEIVRVRPNAKDPRNRLSYVVHKTFAKEFGFDVLLMSLPAVNVEVALDEKPEDMVFEVSIGHRDRDAITAVPADSPRMWRLDRAFFPGSCVVFEWKKKPPVAERPGAPISDGQG
jgi:hypothetical protein